MITLMMALCGIGSVSIDIGVVLTILECLMVLMPLLRKIFVILQRNCTKGTKPFKFFGKCVKLFTFLSVVIKEIKEEITDLDDEDDKETKE